MTTKLTAYRVAVTDGWQIIPAPAKRQWMDDTRGRFAYRCLPLVMANQAGWILTSPIDVIAIWDGGTEGANMKLDFPNGEGANAGQIRSHFGFGILTFSLPWLFRTSPGYGLWARGPSNTPKDNLCPLDGVVETDWAPYTFTMNWRVLRPGIPAIFRKGDPMCMLTPFPLNLLETVEPTFAELDADPVLHEDYKAFVAGRDATLQARRETGTFEYQMDYMRGHLPDGQTVDSHRKAFKLAEFK